MPTFLKNLLVLWFLSPVLALCLMAHLVNERLRTPFARCLIAFSLGCPLEW